MTYKASKKAIDFPSVNAEIDRADFLKFIEPENIREKLANEIMTAHRYLTIKDGVEQYEMIRIVDVNLGSNSSKNTINAISVGFAEVDSETRELLEKNRTLSEALKKATAEINLKQNPNLAETLKKLDTEFN